jgi:predicted YcjX-like family ATPase
LTTSLTSKEIERKRILVSKFKEDAINHIEIQELMAILEKEKHIAEEEDEEEGAGMLVFAISSLISHLSEYLKSQSEIKEEQL